MKIRTLASLFLLMMTSFAVFAAPNENLEAVYDKAFREFDAEHYDEALKALDQIDARQPDLAESLNLRGVVLMRQGKFDQAETTLRKAISLDPHFWNASFNLAEIPFLKKDWVEARNRFEGLMASQSEGMQSETRQLIQYKILLTFVRQGKENTVDWILKKFESAKDSPALYYSKAGIAFQKGNEKEANEWLAAAKKKYPAALDKLYAESIYEIGWMQKPGGESRAALEITSTDDRSELMKADAKANFEKAERAFQQRDFDGATKLLGLAEEGNPNEPAFANLGGEILLEQKKFDEAEALFRKAAAADPKSLEAQYNLAQVPFKKGEYAKARERFEALFAATTGDEKNQAVQLIKYKIFLTLLLEGKDMEAQRLMNQFKFTGDTPALYYAQSAWEFKHGRAEEGNDWITSAQKIYPPALNLIFAYSLYDLGWLNRTENEPGPTTSTLAQAAASSATQPLPAMRLGQAAPLPAPDLPPESAATTTETAANSKTGAITTPAGSAVPVPQPSAQPVVAAAAPRSPASATSPAAFAASPATTAHTPAQARVRVGPTFFERIVRAPTPHTLLVVGLLLAGILLFAWLVVLPFRRSLFTTPLSDDQSASDDESKVPSELTSSGPPRVSLNLKASEPSFRTPLLASGAISARDLTLGVDEPVGASSDGAEKSISEVGTSSLLCDEKEVSRPVELQEAELGADVETPEWEVPAAKASAVETSEVEPPAAADTASEEPFFEEEPVGQGQPIPELTTAFSPEPVFPELTQPEPDLVLIEPEDSVALPIAGREASQSSIETPAFASKILSTEPIQRPSTMPFNMSETTISPASLVTNPGSPAMSVQQPPGGMHTEVQLTFSLEIASMQLTPTFKMSGLQLKPTSRIVSMRLASSQNPHPLMHLQVTFEVAKIELAEGAIATVRLAPSVREKPAMLSSSEFAISGLELVAGSGAAPVQLTPSHQEQASVNLTAHFQIAAIEFTPLFEIAAIVLNSTSRDVMLQLPGSGPTSIENAPVFQIENVQLNGSDIGMIQVVPEADTHKLSA